MIFYNETDVIGQLIYLATVNLTGSLFLTLLLSVMLVMAIFAVLRLPIEISAILIMPLLLSIMAYTSDFMAVGGVFLIYLGMLFGKNFVFR